MFITNPDATSVSLPAAFTVEQGGAPNIWVDIIGRDAIRMGREQTFYVIYGNSGNVDIYDAALFIHLPPGVKVAVAGYPTTTFNLPSSLIPIPAIDFGGETIIPIWVYSIAASSTSMVPLVVTGPLSGVLNLTAELRLAPPSAFSSTGNFDYPSHYLNLLATGMGKAFVSHILQPASAASAKVNALAMTRIHAASPDPYNCNGDRDCNDIAAIADHNRAFPAIERFPHYSESLWGTPASL